LASIIDGLIWIARRNRATAFVLSAGRLKNDAFS
jgi:hypothetical protein